jgi:hypothetical protein
MSLIELSDLLQGTTSGSSSAAASSPRPSSASSLTATGRPANNDYSRALTALLVAERITGWTDPSTSVDDMLRGTEDEPRAVEVYSEHYAPVTTTGFMVRDDWGFRIGYSPTAWSATTG